MMTTVRLLSVAALFVFAKTADAQRLQVTLKSRLIERGNYVSLTDTTLVLSGDPLKVINLNNVAKIQMSDGRKANITTGIIGFLLGGAVGGAIGCAANRDSYGVYCGGQSDTKVFGSAAIGAVVGGAASALLFKHEKWRDVDSAQLRRN